MMTEMLIGRLIAFLLPGLVAFKAISYFSHTAANWLKSAETAEYTVGSFLFLILGSFTCGIIVQAVRWVVIDQLTRLKRPNIDYAKLNRDLLGVWEHTIERYYRLFQFYSNMLVAIAMLWIARFLAYGIVGSLVIIIGLPILIVILYFAARDCYNKVCSAAADLPQKK